MKKQKNILLIFVLLAIVAAIVITLRPVHRPEIESLETLPQKYIKLAGKTLQVELALTPKEHTQGLSGREELLEDKGMLFVFDTPGKQAFWMKDMNFSIDIIWIDEDFSVVHIQKSVSPESYPKIFAPQREAKYVLETVSGFSEKNNLKEGDKVEFLP